MRGLTGRVSAAVSGRFRALDRRLHIDHRGRSEWVWAGPVLTLVGTVVLVIVAGAVISGTTPLLYAPIALFVGVLMAGMSVAYMTPLDDSGDDGGGGDGGPRPSTSRPPEPLGDWARWLRETDASRLPDERAAPARHRERETTRR